MSRLTRFIRNLRRDLPPSSTSAPAAINLLKELPVFVPTSANAGLFPELTYGAANNFPRQVLELLLQSGAAVRPASMTADRYGEGIDAERLTALFNSFGSDKGGNGYGPVYARILEELGREGPLAVLEIGIGTNVPGAISAMGVNYKPGSSLRAFREYLPNATIHGADIHPGTLFSDDRIATALVDQRNPETFDGMAAALGCSSFDLIIDDGLHSTEANLNTAIFAISHLKPKGWLVVEDIPERSTAAWELVAATLSRSAMTCQIIKAAAAFMFVACRREAPQG